MKIESLSKLNSFQRYLMSIMLPSDSGYQNDIQKGLPFFNIEEMDDIEKSRKELTYEEINAILSQKGMILKPATFKKYVNLNLISSSSGRKKKSSVGLYPSTIIREINFIKYALFSNLDPDTFFKPYNTSAFKLISSMVGKDLEFLDYIIDCDEGGEPYTEKFSELISKLLEDKVINKKSGVELLKKSQTVTKLFYESMDVFNELVSDLQGIPVPAPTAIMLVASSLSKKKEEE